MTYEEADDREVVPPWKEAFTKKEAKLSLKRLKLFSFVRDGV